ncbi:MAG: hypothetical protein FJX62_19085 [Alphaproteobacteria bacterium]|nr:hypothetical protein [Alphaproteobacteria bacterium]
MRVLLSSFIAIVLAFAVSAAHADHQRPGMFGDVGYPPPAEDPTHGSTTTDLMVSRCNAFVRSVRLDKEGHIRRYRHNYNTAFCLGWVNSAMVFMNFRDKDGHEMLGVCLPDGVHTVDVVRTFLDYVGKKPDEKKYNPSFLIYWALLEKHPCKK